MLALKSCEQKPSEKMPLPRLSLKVSNWTVPVSRGASGQGWCHHKELFKLKPSHFLLSIVCLNW